MKFHINVCRETITEEDLIIGEPSAYSIEDVGYVSFKELVEWLRDYSLEASHWPCLPGSDFWITMDREPDYVTTFTRDDERVSLHLQNKSPRALRYWHKAYLAAK